MTTDLARQTDEPRDVTIANPEEAAGALAHVLGTGDLGKLSNEQRVGHYLDLCRSLGLNPRSRPFDWIEFYDPQTKAKKLQLYPNRSCAEQLRRQHQISVRVVRREPIGHGTDEPMFVVEVEGTTPNGRIGTATKYVSLIGQGQNGTKYRLSGQQLANAYMKAETGALRRLTFSMVGMYSPPDVEDLARVRVVTVDGTGQVLQAPDPMQRALAADPGMAQAIGEPTYETADRAPSPFVDAADQVVKPEELERPKREGPPPSFRASDEDIKRWCGAWFGIVDETPWDTKEARARVVLQWTSGDAGWPENKVTDSLRTMFARCTDAEAVDFLARARAMVSVWKEGRAAEERGEPELGSDVGMTTAQAAEEIVRQEGYDARPMADLTDEEIEERFEQGTERLLGRPRAESPGPTRTELIADLRKAAEEARQAGAKVDLPDDLAELDDATVATWTADLRKSLEGLRAAF